MKLKMVIASLVAWGLSSPVLAADPYMMMEPSYQMDVMRDQMNKVDWILDKNQPGGFDQPCGWACRINLSGWINTDAYLANRPPVFLAFHPLLFSSPINPGTQLGILFPSATSGRASDLVLNNANFFADARVNNWVTAALSLVYSSSTGIVGSTGPYGVANSLFVYHPTPNGNLVTRSIDTAYATIGNFQAFPVYFRVGKEYVPFGQYDPYSFVQSENPTQLFTETNATVAQLGFIIPNGLYGSVYTFAGNPKLSDNGSTRRIQNGGVDLGYGFNMFNTKVNVDAGYMANITDSNFLSSYYNDRFVEFIPSFSGGLPNEKVPAYNVNAVIQWGPFDASGHYIATTQSLVSPILLEFISITHATFPIFNATNVLGKPKLWGLEAGYTFPIKAHQSRVAVGYQSTVHVPGFLPKQRIYADYMVNMAKWFDLGIALFQDKDYNVGEGDINFSLLGITLPAFTIPIGTGNKSTVGQLRASIKFA